MKILLVDICVSIFIKYLKGILYCQVGRPEPFFETIHGLINPVKVLRLSYIGASIEDG